MTAVLYLLETAKQLTQLLLALCQLATARVIHSHQRSDGVHDD